MGNETLESLLHAWLNMEMSIRGNRVLKEMSFNEMIVCHILLYYQQRNKLITATDLCEQMHLLKSQMNTMITSLENRGYVERLRSKNDRRKVYVKMTETGAAEYTREHEKIIEIMQAILNEIGEENADFLAKMLDAATRIYQQNT